MYLGENETAPPGYRGCYGGQACLDPEHELPNPEVFEPGRYKHVCPGCGNETEFEVEGSTCF